MINDRKLLTLWRENLVEDYQQSLFWNALPSKLNNAVGLFELTTDDQKNPSHWIKQLLDTSAMGIEMNPVPSLVQKLNQLYYGNVVEEKNTNTTSTGFGYPLFIKKDEDDPGKYIAAPIFIWKVFVEPVKNHSNHWRIRRPIKASIQINKLLMYYLEKKYDASVTDLAQQLIGDNTLSEADLVRISNNIAMQVGFDGNFSASNILKSPTEKELKTITAESGTIRWSGVIGSFPAINVNNIKLLDRQLAKTDEALEEQTPIEFRSNEFAAIPTDPYQDAVIRAVGEQQKIVVEGAKGTGKTHTITGLLTNALVNKAKTLVIAPKINDFNNIKAQLAKVGLDQFAFMLTNPKKDREALANALYENAMATKKLPQFEEDDFQQLQNQCVRQQDKLDKSFKALSKKIFGDDTWTEVSGHFLRNHLQEEKQLLNSQLFAKDFKFTLDEHDELTKVIQKSQDLYTKLNTLKHPLRVLRSEIFKDNSYEDAKNLTNSTIDSILEDISALYYKFVIHLEGYSEALEAKFDDYYKTLKNKQTAIKEDIIDNTERYGDDFDKWGIFRTMKLSMFSLFSKRHSNISSIKSKIKQDYEDLQGSYEHKRYFAYGFSKIRGFSFAKVEKNLDDFDIAIEEWKASVPTIIHHELQRLNQENIHPDIEYQTTIDALNTAFDAFIEKLNQHELFVKRFVTDANTLIKKRKYLEEVTETIETLQYNLRDFDDYYNWTHHWLNIQANQQDLIKALIKTKPKSWIAAFNSWYYHNILTQNYSNSLPQDRSLLESYQANYQKLQELLPLKALKYWKYRQNSEVRKAKKENKALHNILFGKNRERHLLTTPYETYLLENFDLITTLFPIFMVTSNMAAEILPEVEGYFDVTVVSGAEEMQVEEALGALWRGKREVIFGDSQLINFSSRASLLSAAKQAGYQSFKLHYHHQHTTEDLFKFRNAAFYNNRIETLPAHYIYTQEPAMSLVKVDGTYLPKEGINEQEAEQIVTLLNGIEPTQENKMPSVGIVCLTENQRNLLTKYISQVKGKKIAGNEKILQLESAGLSILSINDLQSYTFDILIISTTYGNDPMGSFNGDIYKLNNLDALQGLNLMTGAATRKVYVCTSIPTHQINNYTQYNASPSNRGLNILMNYIAYAEACEKRDSAKQERIIINLLAANRDIQASIEEINADSFITEATTALKPYFQEGRIQVNHQLDSINIDFVVEPLYPGESPVAVQCDGFFWRFPNGAYIWEETLKTQLQELGYNYLPIWSVDWWKNPEVASKKLVSYLVKHDAQFAPTPPPALTNDVSSDTEEKEETNDLNDEVADIDTKSESAEETVTDEGVEEEQT